MATTQSRCSPQESPPSRKVALGCSPAADDFSPAIAVRCIRHHLGIELNITGIAGHVLPEVAKLDARPPDPDIDSPPARAPAYPDSSDSDRLHELDARLPDPDMCALYLARHSE
jgi:hypothetical protein